LPVNAVWRRAEWLSSRAPSVLGTFARQTEKTFENRMELLFRSHEIVAEHGLLVGNSPVLACETRSLAADGPYCSQCGSKETFWNKTESRHVNGGGRTSFISLAVFRTMENPKTRALAAADSRAIKWLRVEIDFGTRSYDALSFGNNNNNDTLRRAGEHNAQRCIYYLGRTYSTIVY